MINGVSKEKCTTDTIVAVTCKCISITLCRNTMAQNKRCFSISFSQPLRATLYCVIVEIIYLHECWAHCICERIAFWANIRFSTSLSVEEKGRIELESWLVYPLQLTITWLSQRDGKEEKRQRQIGATIMQIQLFAIILWFMHFRFVERRINDMHGNCLPKFIDLFLWQLQTFIGFIGVCRANSQQTDNGRYLSKYSFRETLIDLVPFFFNAKNYSNHMARDDVCGRREW